MNDLIGCNVSKSRGASHRSSFSSDVPGETDGIRERCSASSQTHVEDLESESPPALIEDEKHIQSVRLPGGSSESSNPSEYPVQETFANFGLENTGRRVSFKVDDGDGLTNVELCTEAESNARSEDENSKNVAPITRSPLVVLENKQTDKYTDRKKNVEKNSKSTETLKEFSDMFECEWCHKRFEKMSSLKSKQNTETRFLLTNPDVYAHDQPNDSTSKHKKDAWAAKSGIVYSGYIKCGLCNKFFNKFIALRHVRSCLQQGLPLSSSSSSSSGKMEDDAFLLYSRYCQKIYRKVGKPNLTISAQS